MSYQTHNQRIMEEYQGGRFQDVPISELEILDDCKVCFPGREGVIPEPEIHLVSPSGLVHEGADYGMTACGHDATGSGWWWST